MIDPILEQKMDTISEEIFGTETDPDQIPATHEYGKKLEHLTPHWIEYEVDMNNNPLSWVVVVPTTKELAQRFIHKEITERELLDLTIPQEKYSALYLCEAVTIPEYRRKGLALKLCKQVIDKIDKTEDYILCAWPVSNAGLNMSGKIGELFNREVMLRE